MVHCQASERERGTHTPIVALTASLAQEDLHRCLEAGVDGHVGKPIRVDELQRAIAQFLPGTEKSPGGDGT